MRHSYEILDAKIEHDHADKRDFLDVTVQVSFDGEAVGEPRRFGFALDASEEVIRAELDRMVASLDVDAQTALDNAEYQRNQEAANETIAALLPKVEEEKENEENS